MADDTNPLEKHKRLTLARLRDFTECFHGKPVKVFPCHQFTQNLNDEFLIDVFVFSLDSPAGPIVAAVTNGLSDQRMVNEDDPERWSRRELIQYFPECTEGHARRLRDMAWLPLFDGFLLDTRHTIQWPDPVGEGTPWKNAFFLEPLIKSHRQFRFEVDGDPASFLWHVPISDEELAFKNEQGADDLLDRMDAVKLPWVFDEKNRPSLLE